MAKYKATKTFKDLDNKHFSMLKLNYLLNGGSVEITDFDSLPESVREHLVEDKPKTKRRRRKEIINNGSIANIQSEQ